MSFLLPGLGQFYAGEGGKGVMFLIFDLVIYGLAASVVGLVFAIPLYLIVVIWAMSAAARACHAAPASLPIR
ncbi:MAG: hypothetical protein ABFE07_16320 [Armatimonadia bacterium]